MRIRIVGAICIALLVGWWLFADTYARHVRRGSADETHPVIRFAHFGTFEDYALWRDVIAEFQRVRRDVRVKQQYTVGLAGHYNTKMRQQILSRTQPEVALVQLGPFHELSEQFADLTPLLSRSALAPPESQDNAALLAESLDPIGLSAFRHHGVQRGFPVSGGNLLIFINPECFARASKHHGFPVDPPRDDWTMEAFRRTAERLTCDLDGDGKVDQFGFWLPRWIYYLPFVWSFGATVTDATQSVWTLRGDAARRAFAFYRELAVGRRVCPQPDEVPQLFQDVAFLTGKVAMCVNGPWFLPFLRQTRLAETFIVAPIPRGPGGSHTRMTWDGVVMAPDLPPRRRVAAGDFIRFLLSKRVQTRIARCGRAFPARTDCLTAFVGKPPDPRRRRFVDAMPASRLQPLFDRFTEVDRTINRHLGQLANATRVLRAEPFLDRLSRDPLIQTVFNGAE